MITYNIVQNGNLDEPFSDDVAVAGHDGGWKVKSFREDSVG